MVTGRRIKPYRHHVLVCFGKRCMARGAEAVLNEFKRRIKDGSIFPNGDDGGVRLSRTGCLKLCKETVIEGEHSPGVILYPEGIWYARVQAQDVAEIIESHIKNGRVVERLCYFKMKSG